MVCVESRFCFGLVYVQCISTYFVFTFLGICIVDLLEDKHQHISFPGGSYIVKSILPLLLSPSTHPPIQQILLVPFFFSLLLLFLSSFYFVDLIDRFGQPFGQPRHPYLLGPRGCSPRKGCVRLNNKPEDGRDSLNGVIF